MSKILFLEKQKFTQRWLWVLLLGITVASIFSIIASKASVSEPKVDKEQFVQTLHQTIIDLSLPMTLVILVIIAICLLLRLEISVTEENLKLQYFPFVKKTFIWEDIESAEIITYGFVGYGIRFSANHGTVYNVKGNQGLFLTWKNGKKRLIGTQRPEELAKVVASILK